MTADERAHMTADERAHIRALVDQVKRQQIAPRLCGWCNEPIPPERVGRGRWVARFCCAAHRKYAWRKTERGQAAERAYWRRAWERRRATA